MVARTVSGRIGLRRPLTWIEIFAMAYEVIGIATIEDTGEEARPVAPVWFRCTEIAVSHWACLDNTT